MTGTSNGGANGGSVARAALEGSLEGGMEDSRGSDVYIRRQGRPFIHALYGALRSIKLYPVENAAVQKALEELTAISREVLSHEHDLEVRVSGEFIFLNATRLRLDLDNYASFSFLLSLCRAAGVGTIRVGATVGPRDWLVLLSLLQAPPREEQPELRLRELSGKLEPAKVGAFELGPTPTSRSGRRRRRSARTRSRWR